MLLMIIVSFVLCIALLAFFVVKIIFNKRSAKKVNYQDYKIDWTDSKFENYDDVDTEGVVSSVYLGENLFYTEKQCEELMKNLNNCLGSFNEKIQ